MSAKSLKSVKERKIFYNKMLRLIDIYIEIILNTVTYVYFQIPISAFQLSLLKFLQKLKDELISMERAHWSS